MSSVIMIDAILTEYVLYSPSELMQLNAGMLRQRGHIHRLMQNMGAFSDGDWMQ